MNPLPPNIHESWYVHLQPLFDDPKMQLLKEAITESTYYPATENVFKVFEMPLNKIRVVIIGQDPYANGEAIGLSFAVHHTTKIPKSLEIVRQELIREELSVSHYSNFGWRELDHWVYQGVFLLNAALTVEPKNPGSHTNMWLWFTKEVVKIISREVTPIWLLWGAKAQAFESYIIKAEVFKFNDILKAPHPAAEAYDPTRTPKFTGCNHFKLVNEILQLKRQAVINW